MKENNKRENAEDSEDKKNVKKTQDSQVQQDMAPMVEEEIDPAIAQLESAKAEAERYKDLCFRTAAEFDNYKKRSQKEKESIAGEVKAACVYEILPVLDNLERALSYEDSEDKNIRQGLEKVLKQFGDVMQKLGVSEIDALMKPFNPDFHNAIMHVEQEGVGENIIVEVLQKGYKLGDRVIRHSIVKVAN